MLGTLLIPLRQKSMVGTLFSLLVGGTEFLLLCSAIADTVSLPHPSLPHTLLTHILGSSITAYCYGEQLVIIAFTLVTTGGKDSLQRLI